MTNIKKRSISFNNAKLKFSSGGPQTDFSSNESMCYSLEGVIPGVIHTTARKNNVGSGLNELNAREKADFAVPKSNVMEEKKVTLAAEDELEPVKIPKTLKKEGRENLGFSPKQQDNHRAEIAAAQSKPLQSMLHETDTQIKTSVKGFSPTMQQIIKNTNTAQKSENPSSVNSTLVKKNINLFNGMNKEQSQEPSSGVSGVKVDDVGRRKVSRLIDQFEQGNVVKGR